MKSRIILKSVGITLAIMILVYRSFWGLLVFPLVYFGVRKGDEQKEKEEKRSKLREEFLQGISVLNNALQAGLSMENAWKEVEKETQVLYGASSEFYIGVKEMNHKVAHNSPIEKLFLEYAYKSKLEEMIQFAELLEFGKRSGSNWKKIIEGTVMQMTERQEARQQIEVMVAEKKMEQMIMNIVPIGLLALLQVSAGDYMSVLYHNLFGCIIMSLFLCGYLIAIHFSQKILKVQL